MNIADAKNISIDDLLQQLGFDVARRTAKGCWYRSPFREETTASFHTTRDGRGWFDFGEGTGGSIIDLAMRLANTDEIPAALAYIARTTGAGYTVPTIRPRLPVTPPAPAYSLVSDKPFHPRSKAGAYLEHERGINSAIVAPYLRDLTYTDGRRRFYGFGMSNIAGGYEARRSPDWGKTSIGVKAPSIFLANRENAPWCAFEGMPDFWTFLTIRKPPVGHANFLILNGTGLTRQAVDALKGQPSGCLYICPQRGAGGEASADRLRAFVDEHNWHGGDIDYPAEFEDYNAWWQSKCNLRPVQAYTVPGLKNTPKI